MLLQLLLTKHQVFALSEGELGETDLVQHKIEMKEAIPFRKSPRRLPYALRAELEAKLTRLEATGCIEQSTSPYAPGLVLVRKMVASVFVLTTEVSTKTPSQCNCLSSVIFQTKSHND